MDKNVISAGVSSSPCNDRSRYTIPDYFLEEFIEQLPEEARVLDAGCGTGFLSKKLIEKGYSVLSIDNDEDKIKKGKKLDRFEEVQIADLTDVELEPQSFDGIISVEVVEHLENPEVFMEKCYGALRSGGVLAIKTPNRLTHDLYHLFFRGKLKVLKGSLDFHPNVMTANSLEALMISEGFETEVMTPEHLPENQRQKLGVLANIVEFIGFERLPRRLYPTTMIIGRKQD